MSTIFRISLLRLWNNKQELLLSLLVPILFFSIFGLIFSRGVANRASAVKVAVIDDDHTQLTSDIVGFLRNQPAVELQSKIYSSREDWSLPRLTKEIMSEHEAEAVIHFPRDLQTRIQASEEVAIELLSEGTNPVGKQIAQSTLSQAVSVALARRRGIIAWLRNRRLRPAEDRPKNLTGSTTGSANARPDSPPSSSEAQIGSRPVIAPRIPGKQTGRDLISLQTSDVYASNKANPQVAMYAAGIAVMFLLFSATGAGGSLLEEHEAGTLDRLLASRLSITELLAGKWLFITCLGCLQLVVMFSWAQLAFGVDFIGHLPGFTVMTVCTASATASLAMFLAVICKSRVQLQGISIVLILTMSALGGSMVPRYLMSEQMRGWGQLTFNAWALDGFQKVFWYDLPLDAIRSEVSVLLLMAIALALMARFCADRWAAY